MGVQARSQIPFGTVISLEILFPFSRRSAWHVSSLNQGFEMKLRGQVRSQIEFGKRENLRKQTMLQWSEKDI